MFRRQRTGSSPSLEILGEAAARMRAATGRVNLGVGEVRALRGVVAQIAVVLLVTLGTVLLAVAVETYGLQVCLGVLIIS